MLYLKKNRMFSVENILYCVSSQWQHLLPIYIFSNCSSTLPRQLLTNIGFITELTTTWRSYNYKRLSNWDNIIQHYAVVHGAII